MSTTNIFTIHAFFFFNLFMPTNYFKLPIISLIYLIFSSSTISLTPLFTIHPTEKKPLANSPTPIPVLDFRKFYINREYNVQIFSYKTSTKRKLIKDKFDALL